MISDFQMAEILQSKFFHDVAGPIGAISNGIDFLTETRSDVQRKAVELMSISSEELINKMNYYRGAFGYMQMDVEENIHKSMKTIEQFFAKNKIRFHWQNFPEQEVAGISAKFIKTLYNLAYITASTMIYGGDITCNLNVSGNAINFHITGQSSSGIKLDRDIIALLVEKSPVNVNSKNINLFYFKRLCEINDIKYVPDINDKISFAVEMEVAKSSIYQSKEELNSI